MSMNYTTQYMVYCFVSIQSVLTKVEAKRRNEFGISRKLLDTDYAPNT